MRLYFKYVSVLVRSQMQYRTSFLLLVAGQFLIPFTVFAGMAFLFDRFGNVGGWTFAETSLCFAVANLSFAVSVCLARGFDSFSTLVVGGDFDRLLVRPRSTVLQVMGSRFELTRAGRVLQGAAVMVWAVGQMPALLTPARLGVLFLMILSGICVFGGIYILNAALCFKTIQGLEVSNIFSDGGREMTQYPLGIYGKGFRLFFTWVIPYGSMNYYPLLWLLGRPGAGGLHVLSTLGGMLFLVPCLMIWRLGVRHYVSTGS